MGRRHRIAQRGTVVLSLCQSVFKLSVLVSGNILPILTFLIRELQQMSGLFLQSWGAGYRGAHCSAAPGHSGHLHLASSPHHDLPISLWAFLLLLRAKISWLLRYLMRVFP